MTLIQFRRDTAANWTSRNTLLTSGEFGFESDTKKFKIGAGNWNSLDYIDAPTVLTAIAPDVIDANLDARSIGFVDLGGGEGYFTIEGVQLSGTLVPPGSLYSSMAGRPSFAADSVARNGSTDDQAALAAADDAALAMDGIPLMLRDGVHWVASNLTIDSPVWFLPGAIIKPDDGVTVTLAGGIVNAPMSQIFDASAGGKVVVANLEAVYPQWWGARGDGVTDDTVALQGAIDSGPATILLTKPSDTSYVFDTVTIDSYSQVRRIVGVGPATAVRIDHKWGSEDYLFKFISPTPPVASNATGMLTDIEVANLNIIGNATAPGGLLFDGCYKVVVDNADVRDYTGDDAVAVLASDCFNVTYKHGLITNTSSGTGIEFTDTGAMQATNFQIWDSLIHSNEVGVAISTTIAGGGFHIFDSAILVPDGGIGVEMTGKFTDITFGVGLHMEAPADSDSTGFKFHGANLYAKVVDFRGIDAIRFKTLFDIDGSSGVAQKFEFEHIYATGASGMNGTLFKLHTVTDVVFGLNQIDGGTIYSSIYDLTANNPAWGYIPRFASSAIPAASRSSGQSAALPHKTWATDKYVGLLSDGTEWRYLLGITTTGRVDVPGDVVKLNSASVIAGTAATPEGAAGAAHGSVYLSQPPSSATGQLWLKTTGATTTSGWSPVIRAFSRSQAQLRAASDTINTSGKVAGVCIFDSTNTKPVWASGSSAGSVWVNADGTTAHTPT